MSSNYDYLHKMAEAHHQDLLREAERQRLVAPLLRSRSLSMRVAHDMGLFLIKLGMWVKQRGDAVEYEL